MDEAWMTCGLTDVAEGYISVNLANVSTGTGFWRCLTILENSSLIPPARMKVLSGTLNLA